VFEIQAEKDCFQKSISKNPAAREKTRMNCRSGCMAQLWHDKTNTIHRDGAKSAKEFVDDFGTNPIVRAPRQAPQHEFVLNFFALCASSR
jgi:hypothetical protein